MRSRSLKTQRLMREYIPAAEKFLQDHPVCQWPLGCTRASAVVHHRRGRFGRRLVDQRWWAASCHDHNTLAEDQTGTALDCGWLVPIESTAAYAASLWRMS